MDWRTERVINFQRANQPNEGAGWRSSLRVSPDFSINTRGSDSFGMVEGLVFGSGLFGWGSPFFSERLRSSWRNCAGP